MDHSTVLCNGVGFIGGKIPNWSCIYRIHLLDIDIGYLYGLNGASISIEWILYTGLIPVLAWREGNIARSAKSIYIAAGLGNKKISLPLFPPPSLI
jgi:hypothetical protein